MAKKTQPEPATLPQKRPAGKRTKPEQARLSPKRPAGKRTRPQPATPLQKRPTARKTAPAPAAREIAIAAHEGLSPAEVTQILRQRARTLAQVPAMEEEGTVIQVVTFSLGQEPYGIEAVHVEGIYPLEGLTPVPCTPDFVVGVVNLRGRILSVLDVHRFLGLEGIPVEEGTQVIAVNAAGLEVGLLASDVRAVQPLALAKLVPALPTATRVAAEYTRGVTADLLVLLDLEALMKDRRIVVHEEV